MNVNVLLCLQQTNDEGSDKKCKSDKKSSKTQKKIDKGSSKKTQKRNQEVCTCVLKGTYVYYRYFLYICIYVLYAHTTLVANCIPFVN